MGLPWSLVAVVLFAMTLGGRVFALPRQQILGCGHVSRVVPFIISGRDATDQDLLESPWHVGIYRSTGGPERFEQNCGGTLVHRRVVVTAAHCLYHGTTLYGKLVDAKDVRVSVGSATRAWSDTPTGHGQHLEVSRIIPHPEYGGRFQTFEADIGVLILATPVTFSNYAKPACIDWSRSDGPTLTSKSVGKVVGWGSTVTSSTLRKPSPVLKVAELPFIPRDTCITVPIDLQLILTRDHFCAGFINGATVSYGDSGSGLTFEHNGLWFLMGVASIGVREKQTYTGFIKVANFYDWIGEVIDKIEEDDDAVAPTSASRELLKSPLAELPALPAVSQVVSDFLASIPHDDGRTETVVAEFPWAARIGVKDRSSGKMTRCVYNGVLISSSHVLTHGYAAYECREHLTAYLGEHNFNSNVDCSTLSGKEVCAPPVVEVPVAEVIAHPEYVPGGGRPSYWLHNIALVRLARKVDFNDFVRPLSLPPHQVNATDDGSTEVGARLIAVGWGKNTDNLTHYEWDPSLHQLPARVLPRSRCELHPVNVENDLCVVSTSQKKGYGICRSWGGAGLIGRRDSPARSKLLALSFHWHCARYDQRVSFLRVAPYVPWILDTMKSTPNGELPPPAVSKAVSDFLASIPHDDKRTKTVVAEFPWAVMVGSKKNGGKGLSCFRNGVLIGSRYVLTSASAARFCDGPLTVRLGEHDSESDKDCSTLSGKEVCAPSVVEVPAASVMVHPEFEFDRSKRTWLWHNIALIRLAREVEFNDFVRPLSLPPLKDNSTDGGSTAVGTRLTIVGWGRTNDTYSNTRVYSPLVQLPAKVWPLSRCETKDYPANVETDLCITSISQEEGFGTCRVWDGAGLIASGRRETLVRPELLGFSSSTICSDDVQKITYLRVAPYVPWILDSMK